MQIELEISEHHSEREEEDEEEKEVLEGELSALEDQNMVNQNQIEERVCENVQKTKSAKHHLYQFIGSLPNMPALPESFRPEQSEYFEQVFQAAKNHAQVCLDLHIQAASRCNTKPRR